jgi:hypothetical protein
MQGSVFFLAIVRSLKRIVPQHQRTVTLGFSYSSAWLIELCLRGLVRLKPFLQPTHTHTHTRARARARAWESAHAYAQTRACMHACSHGQKPIGIAVGYMGSATKETGGHTRVLTH